MKILSSQVHPIDSNSVPYNFSSTVSPLLHSAARALNLPARSSEAFNSTVNVSPPANGSTVSATKVQKPTSTHPYIGSETIAPIDQQYTGHILVSGYNISYVLPKAFPSRSRTVDGLTESEGDSPSRSAIRSRRFSAGERNTAQFMAAIDMWVPYVSRPPRSPYLVRITLSFLVPQHSPSHSSQFPLLAVCTTTSSFASSHSGSGPTTLMNHVLKVTSLGPLSGLSVILNTTW